MATWTIFSLRFSFASCTTDKAKEGWFTGWSKVCANGKQNSHWKVPFGVGVYHLNNRPNLPKEPRTSLTSSKWRLRSSYWTRLHVYMPRLTRNYFSIMRKMENSTLISATAAFMKRDLKRMVFVRLWCRLIQSMSSDRTFEWPKPPSKFLLKTWQLAPWKTELSAAAMLTHPRWGR